MSFIQRFLERVLRTNTSRMPRTSFDDLTKRAADARGKIVLFDVPFTTYGETVRYRSTGASAAARAGAVAMLLRSVASFSMNTPHTGSLRYDTTTTRIPGAAITARAALTATSFEEPDT